MRGREVVPQGVVAIGVAVAVGSLLSLAPLELSAQVHQHVPGVRIPQAYFDEIARNPDAYRFERALHNRGAHHEHPHEHPHGPVATPGRLASSSGTVGLPVVLATYSDHPNPSISRAEVDASLFSGPSARGTVTDLYLEMSLGTLTIQGDVFDWVQTSLTQAQVAGPNNGLGADDMVGEWIVEALDSLDATVDWSIYDNDGPDGVPNSGDDDGYVDVITIEYPDIAGSCGSSGIWPHRWSLTGQRGQAYSTNDVSSAPGVPNILINDYITQSVTDCSGSTVQDAGVIAHEFGHALGLPDYYHPTGGGIGPEDRRWIMGCWALMAGGSWGCGRIGEQRTPFGPSHMHAHSKYQLGWLNYVDPGEIWNQEIVLQSVQSSGEALRIPLAPGGAEYLIVEYRAQEGFDHEIPADGVLMYKQDLTASRRPDPASSDPYYLRILEQDGNDGLIRTHHQGGDRGVAGDAWGVGGVSSPLNSETNPALRLSAGTRTSVQVHEVRVVNGEARIVMSTGAVPQLVAPGGPIDVPQIVSFSETLRIAGGRGPYNLSTSLPPGFTFTAQSDELVIGGYVADTNPFDLDVSVSDVLGNQSSVVTLTFQGTTPWTPDLAKLLRPFLLSSGDPLTLGEQTHVDALGNGNGGYDVGDLRKYLREQGVPPN